MRLRSGLRVGTVGVDGQDPYTVTVSGKSGSRLKILESDSSQVGCSSHEVPAAVGTSASSDSNTQVPASQCEGLTEDLIEAIDDPVKLRKLFVNFYRKTNSKEKELEEFKRDIMNKLKEAESGSEVLKEELYKSVYQAMDEDFNCSICTEIYIEPTVIDCSHTFCKYCITKWMSTTPGKRDCPICRKPNLRPLIRHNGMDSFIAKLLAMLSPEMRDQRAQAIRERELPVPVAAPVLPVSHNAAHNAAHAAYHALRQDRRAQRWMSEPDSDDYDEDGMTMSWENDEDNEDMSFYENSDTSDDHSDVIIPPAPATVTAPVPDLGQPMVTNTNQSERDIWGPDSPFAEASLDADMNDNDDVRIAQTQNVQAVAVNSNAPIIPPSSLLAGVYTRNGGTIDVVGRNQGNASGTIVSAGRGPAISSTLAPQGNAVSNVIGVYDGIEVSSVAVSYNNRGIPITWINMYTFYFKEDNGTEQIWTYDTTINALYQISNQVPRDALGSPKNRHSPCNLVEVPKNYGDFNGIIINEDTAVYYGQSLNIIWINPLAFYCQRNERDEVWIYDPRITAYLQLGHWTDSVKRAFSHASLFTYRKR